MTLKDIGNGPEWVIWVIFAVFALITVLLLSGRGASLIAGYNTAGSDEKKKYNAKRLCRVMGAGMAVITVFILVMAVGEDILPAETASVFGAVTVADVAVMMILANTICKK